MRNRRRLVVGVVVLAVLAVLAVGGGLVTVRDHGLVEFRLIAEHA